MSFPFDLTPKEKVAALVDEGGLTREEAIEELVNSGEIEDADDLEDEEPSEYELERIAENVGIPFWMRV